MAGGDGSSTQEHRHGLLIRATALYDRAAGDPSGSRAEAEELVTQARAAAAPDVLVASMRALAHAYRYLLDHGRAMPLLDEAVRVARRHGLETQLGELLMNRGTLRLELGDLDAASRDFDRAAALLDSPRAAEVDLQRAALAHNAGRLGDAASLYSGIMQQPQLGAPLRTKVANNLGLLEATLGDHTSAEDWLDQAEATAVEVGPAYVALVAETRAWTAVRAGRLSEGVQRFDEAAVLWEDADLPLGELYAEYADALVELRLLPEAYEQADRAARMLTARGVDLMAVEAQLRAAGLALAMGDVVAAEERAENTAAELRRQGRADWRARATLVAIEARLARGTARRDDHTLALKAARVLTQSGVRSSAADAYLTAGRVAAATGRRRLAVTDWNKAARIAPDVPVLARVKRRLAQALAARARGSDTELLRACRLGVSDLAKHRAALPSTELRALASGHGVELSELGLGAALRTKAAAQVLGWMERTRAASLSSVEPGSTDGLDDELDALRAVQTEVARARRGDRAALPSLLSRQSEIEARIRRRSWTAAAEGEAEDRGFSVGSLREALDGRTLVEYDMYDGCVVAAVLEPRRTRTVEVAEQATVEAAIDELRSALQALNVCVPQMATFLHDTSSSIVQQLRSLLVEPLGLSGVDGVVVVPVGELQRVPWSAMFDSPVSVAPSATLWMQSTARAEPTSSIVLVAGPRLDAAVAEVEALSSHHPGAKVLAPPESTVHVVRKALSGASLGHLACHGEVRTDNPTFSSLQLSDGGLTVHELDRQAGAPYRLVLAACDVGGSVTYPGNEVLGFIGTLLSRGTAGVVASTMLVLDEHVTPMMLALHDGVRDGQTLAEALYAARATLDRDDPKAYPAWCTFTAYGAA